MSEVDVVRMIYHMAAVDGSATLRIADRLNELGVPPRYITDGRKVGKRQQATAGIWRAGRVRNMLVSTTYRGVHQYGKRSKKPGRELIERTVPAIIAPDVWEEAQRTLRRNFRFSLRNTRRKYLLRGLVKCGCCGLTYCGTHYKTVGGPDKTYYRCNGRSQARAMYGPNHDQKCPSKALPGAIEELVWADIESFLRDPGEVIHQVRAELTARQSTLDRTTETEALLQASLEAKEVERGRVIALYRRGRIDDIDVDRQLTEIDEEVSAVRERLAELHSQESGVDDARNRLDSIQTLLFDLSQRLADGLDWATKRRVVEELVEVVRVDPSSRRSGGSEVQATVTYHFTAPIENRTGMGSSRLPVELSLGSRRLNRPGKDG
jgi:site-specific DNA recombinase